MNKIKYDILEDSKSILLDAIGSEIQLIFADRIIKEYHNPLMEASYFILKLNKSKQSKLKLLQVGLSVLRLWIVITSLK